MPQDERTPPDLRELRRQAEARLRDETPDAEALSPEAARALIHELRTHQVELEIQNEELRRAQADLSDALRRYSDLYDFAPVGYVTLDDKGVILEANLTLAELVGVERRRLLGQSLLGFVVDEDRRDVRAHQGQALEGKGRVHCEARLRRGDAEAFWASIEFPPLPDESGVARCAIIDTSERHSLEVRLRQAQRLEAIGRLAGGVAQDFNNILTGINGFTRFAMREPNLTPRSHEDLAEVLALARRAQDLTRQLLAFSRRQALRMAVVDVNELIANLSKTIRRLLGDPIEFVFLPAPGLGNVRADRGQIEQIIVNLAINARDAMPDGGRLLIETRNTSPEQTAVPSNEDMPAGDYVVVAVSDTGVGMDPETQAHAFEPFFTTKGVGKGVGLGLASCHGIVRQHGGDIGLSSEPGKGTTFRILLPRVEEPVPQAAETQAPPRGGEETILIVEDEEAVRQLTQRARADLGYEALTASCPSQAREVFARRGGSVDLLLTDMVMRGGNGQRLFEEFVARRPALKVLFMSGYSGQDFFGEGRPARGAAFIQKPFDRDDLARKVRELLDG